jgi:hypothetical protein
MRFFRESIGYSALLSSEVEIFEDLVYRRVVVHDLRSSIRPQLSPKALQASLEPRALLRDFQYTQTLSKRKLQLPIALKRPQAQY